jgi:hypothetical protein
MILEILRIRHGKSPPGLVPGPANSCRWFPLWFVGSDSELDRRKLLYFPDNHFDLNSNTI